MTHALQINHLRKIFNSGTIALDDISLTVAQGDFLALLGPNGAGKSTLISTVCSLIKKNSGQVLIMGIDIDHDFPRAKRMLGVVPQEFNFNMFERVLDIVINQAGYYGIPKAEAKESAEHYLDKLGLWNKRNEASRFLSGGMKRRLMIARALVHQPQLLVLDEPTAGVDIELRRTMWQFLQDINAQGTTIILTTHYLEEAENLCRNVAIIDRGRIIEQRDMRGLLSTLNKEQFVLDIDPASVDLSNFMRTAQSQFKQLSDERIELSLVKGESLNQAFSELDMAGIRVLSMRNKSNRLEELFVELVGEAK